MEWAAPASYINGLESIPAPPEVLGYDDGKGRYRVKHFIGKLSSSSGKAQFLFFFMAYFAINLFFACLLYCDTGGIISHGNVRMSEREFPFVDCVFLSVQSMSTIGFGAMHPISFYSNTVVSFQSFVSVVFFSLMTAVVIAHFLKPSPQWLLSDVACCYFDEVRERTVVQVRVVFRPGAVFTDMLAEAECEVFQYKGGRRTGTLTKRVEFENRTSLMR
jgi:hypothetical protein